MTNELETVTYRAFNDDDLSFLQNSWGSSYFDGNRDHKLLKPEEFHKFHRPIRNRFFQSPNTTVIICCAKDDPWHIVGWIAVEMIRRYKAETRSNNVEPLPVMVIHYIYVKELFKKQGIATELVKRAIGTRPALYTHLTDKANRILNKKFELKQKYRYVPHLV